MRLWLETGVARAVGAVSRRSGRGGGTALPGKVLLRVDAGAPSRLAAGLPHGCALVSATNGKTTTAAMVASILGATRRLVHNRAGANLASGVATALLDARGAELGLFEVDEAALPGVTAMVRPRAILLGNLFRDQLDRYGELEQLVERWRSLATSWTGTLVVNADDPALADLVRDRPDTVRFGLDDPAVGHQHVAHAADSKYCLRCGRVLTYAPAYVGHLGAWSCSGCADRRGHLDVTAREIELHALERSTFRLELAGTRVPVALTLPGLYNVYNAVAAAALAHELGASPDEISAGLAGFRPAFGRVERVTVGERTLLLLLVKNPAGANEVVRTLAAAGARPATVVALNDGIADGRDVSWIWDVDFEPLLAVSELLVASGDRAEELALRFVYAGVERHRVVVEPDLDRALEVGLAATPTGHELVVLPTYTAMLELQASLARRGLVRPYWRGS